MAIAITTIQPAHFGWMIDATSADVSGCEVLKAAPGAGKYIVVDHITLNSTDAIALSIGEGEVGGNLVTTHIGPLEFTAKETKQWDFGLGGMLLTVNTLLGIDADGAGVICFFAYGRVLP